VWTRENYITVALWAAFTLPLAGWGCAPQGMSDDASEEHHIPPHKPPDLPSAIVQLERRFIALAQPHAATQPEFAVRLQELIEIVRWLPELAGDSDLPEAQWNVVYQAAQRLEPLLQAQYARVQRGHRAEMRAVQQRFDATLAQLRAIAWSQPLEEDLPGGSFPGNQP